MTSAATLLPPPPLGGTAVPVPPARRQTTVDVVIPVFNEAAALERCVRRVLAHLAEQPAFAGRVVIADNGSTDGTGAIADALSRELPGVTAIHLAERGRGLALRTAWLASSADIVAYMDVDLSTDLAALAPLIESIDSAAADVAIGSRLVRGAHVTRGLRREVISRGYNALLRAVLRVRVRDAQCGFKALRSSVARQLLPTVEDDGWFFDTELLVRAQRAGLVVAELPVAWVDDPDSRVRIIRTAWLDLLGVVRLRIERPGWSHRHAGRRRQAQRAA